MYKLIREGNLPNWLKALLYMLLTVSCVYWIGYFLYKILNFIRFILHSVSSKEHWWFTVFISIGVAVAFLLFLEYQTDQKPLTQMLEWLLTNLTEFRNKLADFIKG